MASKQQNTCGIFGLSPRWLQSYATTRCFLIVYGFLGTTQAMGYLYFVVTLTTIEKRFKIPSQTTGIILSGNEVSQILLSLVLSYFGGQRNRPRWMAWGVVCCSLSCFILAWPHFIYGAGEEALRLTKEFVADNYANISLLPGGVSDVKGSQLCLANAKPDGACRKSEIFSYVPLVLIFLSQFVLGIGNTLYYSLGQSYLDDNTNKGNTPLVLAYALSLRMFGPAIGFLLGYLSLNIYIDPTKTPLIDNKDPRWLGAWWLGWIVLGVVMLVFAVLIGMFPKELPRNSNTKDEDTGIKVRASDDSALDKICRSRLSLEGGVIENVAEVPQLKDLPVALMRLLRNKVLMCNIMANIFFILGSSGYITFLTKYLEVQYNKTASEGTIVTGPLSIIGITGGFILSGWFISKYRPPPKYVFFWNVILGCFVMAGQFTYMVVQCDYSDSLQSSANFSLQSTCNSNCYCDQVKYNPVCDTSTGTTYFSPCHAGCSQWNQSLSAFTHCQCAASTTESYRSVSTTSAQNTTLEEIRRITISTPFIEPDEEIDGSQEDTLDRLVDNSSNIFGTMVTGSCGQDCRRAFVIFTVLSLVINFLGSTGKIGNILLNFRAVEQRDKAFAQGLSLMLISLLALIPGPIIYGIVIDKTCTVWNNLCGARGNCQLYDQTKFRHYVNMLSLSLTFIGIILDLFVWHYGKDMKLYDDEDDGDVKKESKLAQPHCQPLLDGNREKV